MRVIVNNAEREVDCPPDMPLLWVLRDLMGLTGTKFGCGMAQCGACTVHVDGSPLRSCVTPVAAVAGKRITTIEGLSYDANRARSCRPVPSSRPTPARATPTLTPLSAAISVAAARIRAFGQRFTGPPSWQRPEAVKSLIQCNRCHLDGDNS